MNFEKRVRRPALLLGLLGGLLVLTLALAPRANALVYWAQGPGNRAGDLGSIGRANLDGSDVDPPARRQSGKPCKNCPTRPFIRGASSPCGVAVDAEHVYWANQFTQVDSQIEGQETIGRANLDGTGVSQSFIPVSPFDPYSGPCGVAVDATHVYWANPFGAFGEILGILGWVGRANLDGTGIDQDFIPEALYKPCGVAVDATHVYWAAAAPPPGLDESTIGRANLDGTGVNPSFITGGPPAVTPCGVAVDATHIYWANTNAEAGTIGRANLDGTGVDQSFISGGSVPCGVAVDDAHIYWANRDSRRIGRANLDGSGVDQSFVRTRFNPCGVAVDGLWSFRFGKVKRNRNKGTARLTVDVPRLGKLALAGNKKVKSAESRARPKRKSQLPIEPRPRAKKQLNTRGKAKVEAEVTYTATGGSPNTESKKIKLIKR